MREKKGVKYWQPPLVFYQHIIEKYHNTSQVIICTEVTLAKPDLAVLALVPARVESREGAARSLILAHGNTSANPKTKQNRYPD